MNGKDGKCSQICEILIPKCGDGLGFSKDCPPPPPPPCEGDECLLITPECLQCPCQYADFGNMLNKNDDVRAKIWDQDFGVLYDLSPFVSIERYLKKR